MVRSMMAKKILPISYWGDAFFTATYVLNWVPLKTVASTPYKLWNNQKPDLINLWPWRSTTYIHNLSHKYGKLGHKGRKCIFIRYTEHFKGYVFISDHEDGTITELESLNATFFEDNFPCISEIDKDLHLYEMMDPNIRSTPKQQLMFEPNGSELVPRASIVKYSMLRKSSWQIILQRWFEIEGEVHIVTQYDDVEPKSVQEALTCLIKNEWRRTMEEELELMQKNQVQDLVDLPSDWKAIWNKWVLKIKWKTDGFIENYKARLVAKGYTQQEGMDYEETFL